MKADDLIEAARNMAAQTASAADLGDMMQRLKRRDAELNLRGLELQRTIEQPHSVAEHDHARTELASIAAEQGIIGRLIRGDVGTAYKRALALEAAEKADADRKDMAQAVADAEQSLATYEAALARAQAAADQIAAALSTFNDPSTKGMAESIMVHADPEVAARLAALLEPPPKSERMRFSRARLFRSLGVEVDGPRAA